MSDREAPRSHRILRNATWVVLLLVIAALGAGLFALIGAVARRLQPTPTETVVVRPTADVIVAIRDLARLETASYHVERVIDMTSQQRRVFGLVEAQDSILLVAAADVTAGVDLTELRDGDVTVDEQRDRVTIVLPPARVFSAALDNERTYVHRRETDLLARRRDSLETEARREAERNLERAAIEGGILARADRNAARTIEALVRSLGFSHVEIRQRTELD